jgi:hypothetical protein
VTPPSDMALVDDGLPAPPVSPWIDRATIAAANARDVVERRDDDHSLFWKRQLYERGLGATLAARRRKFTFGAQARPESAPKVERTPEVRAYFRQYMRERRARQKADALVNSHGAPS